MSHKASVAQRTSFYIYREVKKQSKKIKQIGICQTQECMRWLYAPPFFLPEKVSLKIIMSFLLTVKGVTAPLCLANTISCPDIELWN